MFTRYAPPQSISRTLAILVGVGGLSLTGLPSGAQAGFEWTPPPVPVQAADAGVVAAPEVPLAGPLTPEPDALLPVPVGNVEMEPAPAEQEIETKTEPLKLDNLPAPESEQVQQTGPSDASSAPMPVPAPETAAVTDGMVEGFGKDIPLAIALRDIVPTQYAYSFYPREIAGTRISWRGGKPWQDVLRAALASHSLDMSLSDTHLTIYSVNGPVVPTATPAATMSQSAMGPESVPIVRENYAPPVPLSAEPTTDTVSAEPMPVSNANILPVVDMQDMRKWEARPGTTLREALESWAQMAHVELTWSTAYDYPVNNAFYFEGNFAEAVDSLLSSYAGETPSPKGRLHPNLPDGPSVLLIN